MTDLRHRGNMRVESPEVPASLFDDFDQTPVSEDTPEDRTLDERFWMWVHAAPEVVEGFMAIALDLHRLGYKHCGAKLIAEQTRWRRMMRSGPTSTVDDYKINNSYVSRLARLTMARHPALAGFFQLRELHS